MSIADSFERGICQNPELALSFEKTVAPASCARVGSTACIGCLSHRTLSLSFVRSTHRQTFPFALGTTTNPAHHSVGCSTRSVTPSCSICSSSSLTRGRRGIVTLRGVERACSLPPLSGRFHNFPEAGPNLCTTQVTASPQCPWSSLLHPLV